MENYIIARRKLFSSAHFYKQDQFSDDENRKVFGNCYSKYGHGHNYVVEAFIRGTIVPATRLVVDIQELDEILEEATRTLDHRHLNFDVPEFAETVPTTENIALYLRNRVRSLLRTRCPAVSLERLRLFETDDLYVEIRG